MTNAFLTAIHSFHVRGIIRALCYITLLCGEMMVKTCLKPEHALID